MDYMKQLAQDVRDIVYDLGRLPGVDVTQLETLTEAADAIDNIPGIQKNSELNFKMWQEAQSQVPKVGEWIVKYDGQYGRRRTYCSVCGQRSGIGGIEKNQAKPYCPNCGARLYPPKEDLQE